MTSWVARLSCNRREAEAAIALDEPFPGIAPPPILTATEGDGGWLLELHTGTRPSPALLAMLSALAPSAPDPPSVEEIPEADWVVQSQAGQAPVDAGRFHVFPGHRAGEARPGQIALRIEASLAFGTGQHATTAGCLLILDRLARQRRLGRVLDLGTGSGVLAIAAARADRSARVIATDIDPVAIRVARRHAGRNHADGISFGVGAGLGATPIRRAAPFDLVLANILARPLIELAEGLSWTVRPGGLLLLAGLLRGQERAIRAAFGARGFRLVQRLQGDWPILLLARRGRGKPPSRAAAIRAARRGKAAAWRSAGTI
ncbi:50S ribosomal protein L11 methyltransferase [Thermaurantiacus sp.]